jgi:hypothetical protein
VVAILPDSTGTSEKLRFSVSKKVPPGGTAAIVSVVGIGGRGWEFGENDEREQETEYTDTRRGDVIQENGLEATARRE